ncbi:hypothetical protein BC831DRAFT_482415 [Entophlyctis helioformis]|nr:hypothetical protein BC831DRAFT_482415 [Entophlyctis helioformis]
MTRPSTATPTSTAWLIAAAALAAIVALAAVSRLSSHSRSPPPPPKKERRRSSHSVPPPAVDAAVASNDAGCGCCTACCQGRRSSSRAADEHVQPCADAVADACDAQAAAHAPVPPLSPSPTPASASAASLHLPSRGRFGRREAADDATPSQSDEAAAVEANAAETSHAITHASSTETLVAHDTIEDTSSRSIPVDAAQDTIANTIGHAVSVETLVEEPTVETKTADEGIQDTLDIQDALDDQDKVLVAMVASALAQIDEEPVDHTRDGDSLHDDHFDDNASMAADDAPFGIAKSASMHDISSSPPALGRASAPRRSSSYSMPTIHTSTRHPAASHRLPRVASLSTGMTLDIDPTLLQKSEAWSAPTGGTQEKIQALEREREERHPRRCRLPVVVWPALVLATPSGLASSSRPSSMLGFQSTLDDIPSECGTDTSTDTSSLPPSTPVSATGSVSSSLSSGLRRAASLDAASMSDRARQQDRQRELERQKADDYDHLISARRLSVSAASMADTLSPAEKQRALELAEYEHQVFAQTLATMASLSNQ